MPINLNKDPYYDDFVANKNFLQILFKPGRAVQARELTQLQTILKTQISSMASYMFHDGAKVIGGGINVQNKNGNIRFVKIKDVDVKGVSSITALRKMVPGLEVRRLIDNINEPEVVARITNIIVADAGTGSYLYVHYLRGESPGFQPEEHLVVYNPDISTAGLFTLTTEATSAGAPIDGGTHLSVSAGLYYYKDNFIQTMPETITLSREGSPEDGKIGYDVHEVIVSSSEDQTLLDPARGMSNQYAPGADRYELKPTLVYTNSDSVRDNFFEIGRIVGGRLVETGSNEVYNKIKEAIARRTYEESGNYIATPYKLSIENKTTKDSPFLLAKLSEGVAYVKGHRLSPKGTSLLNIRKARTHLECLESQSNLYGDNFVYIFDGLTGAEKANGLFAIGSSTTHSDVTDDIMARGSAVDIHSVPFSQVVQHGLTDAAGWESTLIGTARPYMMAYDDIASVRSRSERQTLSGNVYRLWLNDFKANTIVGATTIANRLSIATAHSGGGETMFKFDGADTTHGITTEDRIQIVTSDDTWNIFDEAVSKANTTGITIGRNLSGTASLAQGPITLYRTTSNVNALQSATLDLTTSAQWNHAYDGAKIEFTHADGTKETRKIVDSVGSSVAATTSYGHYATGRGGSTIASGPIRKATVLLETPLKQAVAAGIPYKITMDMKQARSIVYNQNRSAVGDYQYPAGLYQAWNIDKVNGIRRGYIENKPAAAGNPPGDCIYNDNNQDETLIFPLAKSFPRQISSYGDLSSGYSSNTSIHYMQHSYKQASATDPAMVFPIPASTFISSGPRAYPYDGSSVTNATQIKDNYILVNRTTGNVHSDITQVVPTEVLGKTTQVEVTRGSNFTSGHIYELLLPVKSGQITPAYKQLIKANTTWVTPSLSAGETNFNRGQFFILEADVKPSPGSIQSLDVPDGFVGDFKVIENFDPSSPTPLTTGTDATSKYTFNSGQKDIVYDNAYIQLKDDIDSPPAGNVFVMFGHFKRVDTPKSSGSRLEVPNDTSFFSVDSYQCTTDLVFSDVSFDSPFVEGDMVTSSTSGATGYVVGYANTPGYSAKIQLEAVSGVFGQGDRVDAPSLFGTDEDKFGIVESVVTADLTYGEIPSYENTKGITYKLHRHIDCRPHVVSNTKLSDSMSNSIMPPIPSMSEVGLGKLSGQQIPVVSSHILRAYAPRIDLVVVNSEGNYYSIMGNPSFIPAAPRVQSASELVLFTINVPPYTTEEKAVKVIENKEYRHTMKDISRLSKRVENLEYYVSLNALEKSTSDMLITDSDGLNRFKNGILVDNFLGNDVTDYHGKHGPDMRDAETQSPKYSITDGYLSPGYDEVENLNVVLDTTTQVGEIDLTLLGRSKDTTALLKYSELPFIVQPGATGSMSVNPYEIQDYSGGLTLTPALDSWYDMTSVSVGANIQGLYNNLEPFELFGTQESLDEFKSLFATGRFWESVAAPFGAATGTSERLGQWPGEHPIGAHAMEYGGLFNMRDSYYGVLGHTPQDDDVDYRGRIFGREFLDSYRSTWDIAPWRRQIELSATGSSLEFGQMSSVVVDQIEAALAAAMAEGTGGGSTVLPYVRERDVIVYAEGLKPSHKAMIKFDERLLERRFIPATKIYIKSPGGFSPQTGGQYERIRLHNDTNGRVAHAMLLAVEEDYYALPGYKAGYIVPVFHNENSGLVDFSTYSDGYYGASWTDSNIREYGFQGSQIRKITGDRSGSVAELLSGTSMRNGHYHGTARFSVVGAGNTTHVELSPDAHQYVANNFGISVNNVNVDLPAICKLDIAAGTGAGQSGMVEEFFKVGNVPIVKLRSPGLPTAPTSSSVYTLAMRPSNRQRNPELSQFGTNESWTTKYGEKIGMLHVPGGQFAHGQNLVEVSDRADNSDHLITAYAAAYYHSEGSTQTTYDNAGLISNLQALLSPSLKYRVEGVADGAGAYLAADSTTVMRGWYQGASQANYQFRESGKLIIASGISVTNSGISTGYQSGEGAFGTVGLSYFVPAEPAAVNLDDVGNVNLPS